MVYFIPSDLVTFPLATAPRQYPRSVPTISSKKVFFNLYLCPIKGFMFINELFKNTFPVALYNFELRIPPVGKEWGQPQLIY